MLTKSFSCYTVIKLQIRKLSTSELATALRPFYFAVHPDLFGRHPQQRAVNEESLKHLSVHLEAIMQRRSAQNVPKILKFYIREPNAKDRDSFKLINVTLGQGIQEPKIIIKNLLKSCNLSTKYVENLKNEPKSMNSAYSSSKPPQQQGDINFGADFDVFEFAFRGTKMDMRKKLKSWLHENIEKAKQRSNDTEELKEEVSKLQRSLILQLNLKDLRYECGWNYEHYRGCLKTFERLTKMHEKSLKILNGRIVVFAPFTGVSLEGHVMFFTGDVLNNWLDFIKKIPSHDSFLKKVPLYEHALSQVLLDIKIARRKFMPKQQAVEYAGHLNKVTTTLGDYLSTNKYPKSWPDSLSDYEIVIESESGPVMVSPTGQLIIPANCPGSIVVDFITNHLQEAKEKNYLYNQHKHIEKKLHQLCIDKFHLKSLTKEDSVTPDKMIQTLEKLLANDIEDLNNIHLNITNYFSVLSDGTVCIPWDFQI